MTNYKYKGDFEYCKLQMYTFRIHVFSSTKGQWLPIYQWSGYKLQITKGTSNNTNNKLQISKGTTYFTFMFFLPRKGSGYQFTNAQCALWVVCFPSNRTS